MMNEPWFDPNRYAWIPGTVLGVAGGLLGGLVGILAPRGKAKGIILASMGMVIALSVLLLILGIVALAVGQPYGVWYGLGLAGLIGTVVFGSLIPVVLARYREAERRRMAAKDL